MPQPDPSPQTPHRSHPDSDFTFYDKPAYFRDLGRRIARTTSGDQIALMSMGFSADEPGIQPLLQELSRAAQRGARATLVIDAYNFINTDRGMPGPLLFFRQLPSRMPAYFQHNLDALHELQTNGGHYAIINWPGRPLLSPFKNRSHIKHAIINDRVYIGGCNLDGQDSIDSMIGWDDAAIAGQLYELTQQIAQAGGTSPVLGGEDRRLPVDARTELFIDAGRPGQSAIFQQALDLIDSARESIYMTCQFFPNRPTIDHLQAAYRRGVKVELIYNHPSKHGALKGPLHYAVLARERRRVAPELSASQLSRDHPFLHAKLIATEKDTFIGSHNYVQAGVDFGTAEIAVLRRDDPIFASRAIHTIRQQIG